MTSTAPRSRLKLKAPEGREERSGLLADQRGATMVMGVFIAMLLVGMIYYVWGIGDAIVFRERMQDASDTAAFSAAVIHARGMNMLALINMVMAALAFVSATLATIAAMIGYAAAAAGLVCAGCGPWCGFCCSACPYAVRHGIEYVRADRYANNVERITKTIARGLHGYAVGIRYGVPLAAQAKVVSYGTSVYAPVTQLGVMAPLRLQLPAQDDETNWPCNEKVLPWVRIAAPAGVLIFGSTSIYMGIGVIAGEADAGRITRNMWCRDGFFQRITDDAQDMGNDEYQVQAYMIGDQHLEWTQKGVAAATWGQDSSEGQFYTNLAKMGRISFAQAEFYYHNDGGFLGLGGDDDWQEWLWHMNWRARLRRWRLSATGLGAVMEACGGGAACSALGGLGNAIDGVVVH
ncbi:MAG TPA: hypothetical protein VIL20_08790 [Sandaracinaceae bacterium]